MLSKEQIDEPKKPIFKRKFIMIMIDVTQIGLKHLR